MICSYLNAKNHNVTSIADGRNGLQMIKQKNFDIVLLDLAMSEYSGYDLIEDMLKDNLMDKNNIVVLTASSVTRDDEEKLLVDNWLKLDAPRPLLVIAPRHIQRLSAILDDLKPFGLTLAVRSRNEPVKADTDVYLADTFGELDNFIAGAEFVLMGGGFKPHGGQNLLEAARAGKAVIVGQHMENFQAEARDLVAAGGAIQVENESALVEAIKTLLDDRAQRDRMGAQARALIEANQDMAERYLHELQELCPGLSSKF